MQSKAFVANWLDRLAYPDERARPARLAWECLRRSPAYAQAFVQRDCISAAARFGVAQLLDPCGDELPQFLRTCATVRGSWDDPPRPGELAGKLWIAFDPRLPSEPQIASASRWVRERLAAAHRAHPALAYKPSMRLLAPAAIVLALRVYDARATDVAWSTIVKTFFIRERARYKAEVTPKLLASTRRQATRSLDLARRLIDSGYLELALRDEYRPGDVAHDDDLAPPRFAAVDYLLECDQALSHSSTLEGQPVP